MYLIAEIGTNHNGSPEAAIAMSESAIGNGANAVKMQLFEADTLVDKSTPVVAHAKGSHATQWARMKSLELPIETYAEISRACEDAGVDFIISPFSVELVGVAAKYANKLKVASGELTNTKLLEACRDTGLPCFLSTGMTSLEETAEAVYTLDPTVVMHCVSLYPTQPWQANLQRIGILKSTFPNKTIGYSNHTAGLTACLAAAAIGAEVLEVHYVPNKDWDCADAPLSICPRDFRKLRVELLKIEDMLKGVLASDYHMRKVLRRGPSGLRGDYVAP